MKRANTSFNVSRNRYYSYIFFFTKLNIVKTKILKTLVWTRTPSRSNWTIHLLHKTGFLMMTKMKIAMYKGMGKVQNFQNPYL